MSEAIRLDGLVFRVRRSIPRKTFGLTVERSGRLVAHAPADAPLHELLKWTKKKLLWVHRKLALRKEMVINSRAPQFIAGESFSFLGRRHQLKFVKIQERALQFDGSKFSLRSNARSARAHLKRWYIERGKELLPSRVAMFAKKTKMIPKRVEVRDLHFRWGSCGKGGVIFLNWKLLQLPLSLIDYVIAHELVHLSEHRHGAVFWRRLSDVMPDWERRKDELALRAKEHLVLL